MRDDDTERADEYPGPFDLPDEHEASEPEGEDAQSFSLTDDVLALIERNGWI